MPDILLNLKPLSEYVRLIEKNLATGNYTEHTHRSALKSLIESLGVGIIAINEPHRIECGAPDFVINKGSATVGYVEAKDIGKSLDEEEKSEQLKRYRDSLTNLILTDYIEFRWYVDGERRLSARLGYVAKEGKIKRDKDGITNVAELLSSFFARRAEAVGTPKELALRMARLAHMIRNLIVNAFGKEPESGSLHTQLLAFRDNLIPDLKVEQFADMYAQTIAYGLFAARCANSTDTVFTRQNAAYLLPKTNPFLRKMFNYIAGPDLDDRIAWLVDDLAQVLSQADMEAVLKDFGKRTAKEDPVVHFYETFLAAYDPKIREMRGVYYTPETVVSYIVRSIDYLLKTRFNKPQGLADEKTLILDPAVGTATFLYMVINEIHQVMVNQGQKGLWNDYVADKLLPRIFGFELLMAPYAVAHLKLGLLLQETGYQFKSDQRLGIYLTNTLEEAIGHSETLFAQWITQEANAAADIKKEKEIMVVLGNPPYSGISENKGEWISKLIDDYREVDGKPLGERKVWLQNDYVKFIRFGQWRIECTRQGILAFVTDHSYLDNPTFRGMRQDLLNSFSELYILDLHGDSKRKETTPNGGKDENVFDIQEGVCIAFFIKEADKTGPARVYHSDIWGLREQKYHLLSETDITNTNWAELSPNSPFYFFVPWHEEYRSEYEQGWKVTDIFPINSVGAMSGHDFFIVTQELGALHDRVDFLLSAASDAEVLEKYGLGNHQNWRLSKARERLKRDENWGVKFTQFLYRPFDYRFTFYSDYMFARSLVRSLHHMLHANLGLCIGRAGQVVGQDMWDLAFCSNMIIDLNLFYRGGNVVFPLYCYSTEGEFDFDERRRPNINPRFIEDVSVKLGLTFVENGKGDYEKTYGPEDIFNYAYAIFHSPTYRTRYAEFLKIDFPRLPVTSDIELFKALAAKGAELVALHLMESSALNNLITKYPITGTNTVDKVTYFENTQRVDINKTQYFEGVPPGVWNFHIGGYHVCQKWLKDRKGRALTYDELTHYQKIVVALKETIRLMGEIDALIPSWPLA